LLTEGTAAAQLRWGKQQRDCRGHKAAGANVVLAISGY